MESLKKNTEIMFWGEEKRVVCGQHKDAYVYKNVNQEKNPELPEDFHTYIKQSKDESLHYV